MPNVRILGQRKFFVWMNTLSGSAQIKILSGLCTMLILSSLRTEVDMDWLGHTKGQLMQDFVGSSNKDEMLCVCVCVF